MVSVPSYLSLFGRLKPVISCRFFIFLKEFRKHNTSLFTKNNVNYTWREKFAIKSLRLLPLYFTSDLTIWKRSTHLVQLPSFPMDEIYIFWFIIFLFVYLGSFYLIFYFTRSTNCYFNTRIRWMRLYHFILFIITFLYCVFSSFDKAMSIKNLLSINSGAVSFKNCTQFSAICYHVSHEVAETRFNHSGGVLFFFFLTYSSNILTSSTKDLVWDTKILTYLRNFKCTLYIDGSRHRH